MHVNTKVSIQTGTCASVDLFRHPETFMDIQCLDIQTVSIHLFLGVWMFKYGSGHVFGQCLESFLGCQDAHFLKSVHCIYTYFWTSGHVSEHPNSVETPIFGCPDIIWNLLLTSICIYICLHPYFWVLGYLEVFLSQLTDLDTYYSIPDFINDISVNNSSAKSKNA